MPACMCVYRYTDAETHTHRYTHKQQYKIKY